MFLKIFLNIYLFITLKLKRMLKTFYLLKCKIVFLFRYNNEIENMRAMDENDRGLAMDMHNILRGDESKCIVNEG